MQPANPALGPTALGHSDHFAEAGTQENLKLCLLCHCVAMGRLSIVASWDSQGVLCHHAGHRTRLAQTAHVLSQQIWTASAQALSLFLKSAPPQTVLHLACLDELVPLAQ